MRRLLLWRAMCMRKQRQCSRFCMRSRRRRCAFGQLHLSYLPMPQEISFRGATTQSNCDTCPANTLAYQRQQGRHSNALGSPGLVTLLRFCRWRHASLPCTAPCNAMHRCEDTRARSEGGGHPRAGHGRAAQRHRQPPRPEQPAQARRQGAPLSSLSGLTRSTAPLMIP